MRNRLFWLLAAVLVLGMGAVLGVGLVYLGSQPTIVQAAASLQAAINRDNGLLVGAVQADSPAAKAGLVRGDIIQEVNGKALDEKTAPRDLLNGFKVGDKLTLKVLHGDVVRSVEVTLTDQNGNPFLGISPAFVGRFGFRGMFGFGANGQKMPLTPGARVTQVVAGGPSEKAGLKVGDVILKVNDTLLDANNNLAKVLASLKPGDNVKLNVQRGGQTAAIDITVTLGDNPNQAGQAYLGIQYVAGNVGPKFGNGQPLPQMPNFPQVPGHAGLFISEVKTGSPAEKAGLKVNDLITEVNGKAAGTPDDLVNLVKAAKIGDTLSLTILRKGETNSLKIDVILAANPDQKDQAYLGVSIGGMMRGFQRGAGPNKNMIPTPATSGGNS